MTYLLYLAWTLNGFVAVRTRSKACPRSTSPTHTLVRARPSARTFSPCARSLARAQIFDMSIYCSDFTKSRRCAVLASVVARWLADILTLHGLCTLGALVPSCRPRRPRHSRRDVRQVRESQPGIAHCTDARLVLRACLCSCVCPPDLANY